SEDENLLSKLFQHRFSSSGDLEGHSFGNLFLAALTAMTGDFAVAVKKASEILATRGHILPATSANVELEALMDDGSRVRGETRITASDKRLVELTMVPAHPEPLPQTIKAIADADIITVDLARSSPVSYPTCWYGAYRKPLPCPRQPRF